MLITLPFRTLRRLVEDADLQAAKDLFGADLDLDRMQPKSAKDFEDLARALVAKYLHPHSRRCGLHVRRMEKSHGACLAVCAVMPCVATRQVPIGTCLVDCQKALHI